MNTDPEWLVNARKNGLVMTTQAVRQSAVAHAKPLDLSAASINRVDPELAAEMFNSEAEFQQGVIKLAQSLGWMVAWFRPVRVQRKNGSIYYETPVGADGEGFLDLVMVRERTIYAELKYATGLRPRQKLWKKRLEDAGEEVYVWKPKDWREICDVLTANAPKGDRSHPGGQEGLRDAAKRV